MGSRDRPHKEAKKKPKAKPCKPIVAIISHWGRP